MQINLIESEVKILKEILVYFVEVPRKLWKQHYDYLDGVRVILAILDRENELNLLEDQEKALSEYLKFFIYMSLPFWEHSVEPYCTVAEDILFKKLKQKRFNLITLKYELYNEQTDRFEVCRDGDQC